MTTVKCMLMFQAPGLATKVRQQKQMMGISKPDIVKETANSLSENIVWSRNEETSPQGPTLQIFPKLYFELANPCKVQLKLMICSQKKKGLRKPSLSGWTFTFILQIGLFIDCKFFLLC
ncbi:hypothetical protein MANES_13G025000v8 [Manihot esculenta]|uniref:Uncharacterized protein n=3 Tax=Manihot esculenta TaxID=3983 RepID=A0ACB7GIL6_MANES|nr:hypothetical protein MANES_13G025000v8 [Manihot esculenta]